MRRSAPFRLLALVLALIGSLSATALGLGHDLEHAHVARDHRADAHHEEEHHGVHGVPGLAIAAQEAHHHGHDHPRLDLAPVTRDLGRFDQTPAPVAVAPMPATLRATFVVVRSPALTDRAVLARPDPGGGPPPALRAPPLG